MSLTRFSTIAGILAFAALLAAPALAQDTRSFTDDAGRVVEIPLHPQRIASLQDLFFTIPLIELGAPPVGSHGRVEDDGTPYLRSAKMLTGFDYDNTGIQFLGTGTEIDPEKVAALEPDLIILSNNQKPEQYEQIAPTILIDFVTRDKYDIYQLLAELTGTEETLARLDGRYAKQIEQIKRLVDTPNVSVNVFAALEGQIRVYRHFASLGRVLRDAGYAMPEAVRDIPDGENASFSAEMLPEMDADVIFLTYLAERGETAQDAYAQMEALVPGFCDYLTACKAGNLVAIPRDETTSTSYNALSMMAFTVLTATSPRPAAAQ